MGALPHDPRDNLRASFDPYGAVTHEVINQPVELCDYNLYGGDAALREAVRREGAAWAADGLMAFGASSGSAESLEQGVLANRNPPDLDTHDRYGRRVDLVRFHPAYHALMKVAIEEGIHSSPWTNPGEGAHVARAARFYMQSQVEAGHGCPITMTFAATPCLKLQPDLARQWLPRVQARVYDPRNVPAEQKQGVMIGMAMTEKQGGSDVRANTTRAIPIGAEGAGGTYELVGHKFFVSAPMCDAFLALAQAPGGLSCFLVPRWRPDGTKNPLQIIRLKRKMGNVSNASSETELRGALGWMVGAEGRGVATIIEMVAMTRFDCMIGSSAGMRMATSQAIDHCRQRKAFGAFLIDQPIMTAVLADLAIEAEAALTLTMRIARALDHRDVEHEDALVRTRDGDRQVLDLQARTRPRLRGSRMHRRLWGDGGFADAAPLSRGPGQRDLGRQRQRPVPRHRPRHPPYARNARRLFRGDRVSQRRKRGPGRACRGAEGRSGRSFGFRVLRSRPLRPARGRVAGSGARARWVARRGSLLPLAPGDARRPQLRRARRR